MNINTEKVAVPEMIKYIERNVNDLSIEERQDILRNIMNSSIESHKIQSKGDGTQIKFRDIPVHIISSIYYYIQNKLAGKLADLQYFPDNTNVV